jgi:hypothetical protein
MNVIHFLATSLYRRGEVPNQELAKEIIASKNTDWVKELVENLNNKDKNIQSDCIKILYEIGERGAPELISPYWDSFIKILQSTNNRLIWGAMTAINMITLEKPDEIFQNLKIINETIKKGSVITIDGGISVLAKLASIKKYEKLVIPILIEQLAVCPAKQFPMYNEKSMIAMKPSTKEDFLGIIDIRFKELEKETQKKRVGKVLNNLKTV